MRASEKTGRRAAPLDALTASSGPSAERIEAGPEITFGASRLLVAAERTELGAEQRYAGDQAGERLPERDEEALVVGSVGRLLASDSREGKEDEEEEDDGDARPHCMRHGRTSLPGDVGFDPGRG